MLPQGMVLSDGKYVICEFKQIYVRSGHMSLCPCKSDLPYVSSD